MSGLGRAVLLCALLSGLFLMHGTAPPAAGCQGGSAMITAAAAPGMAGPVMASATPGGHQMATMDADSVSLAPRVPAVKSTGRPTVAAASSAASGGMACSSLPPRQVLPGTGMMPLTGAVAVPAAAALAWLSLAVVWRRAARPPGPPRCRGYRRVPGPGAVHVVSHPWSVTPAVCAGSHLFEVTCFDEQH